MKRWALIAATGAMLTGAGIGRADDNAKSAIPDNSARNKVVNAGPTADDQSNAKPDVQLAASVRRAIVGDKTLSTNAHNVKIIANAGTVYLRGPVKNAEEKQQVEALASKVTGVQKIQNELETTH